MRNKDNMFYSNCFIEAMKAKIKNPKGIKLTHIPSKYNEIFWPHWMWSDGEYDYDFGIDRHLKWYEKLWFKGSIRKRKVGFNERWKKNRMDKYYSNK